METALALGGGWCGRRGEGHVEVYVSADKETGGTGDGRNGTGGRVCRLVLVGGINSGWLCAERAGRSAGGQAERANPQEDGQGFLAGERRGPRCGALTLARPRARPSAGGWRHTPLIPSCAYAARDSVGYLGEDRTQ